MTLHSYLFFHILFSVSKLDKIAYFTHAPKPITETYHLLHMLKILIESMVIKFIPETNQVKNAHTFKIVVENTISKNGASNVRTLIHLVVYTYAEQSISNDYYCLSYHTSEIECFITRPAKIADSSGCVVIFMVLKEPAVYNTAIFFVFFLLATEFTWPSNPPPNRNPNR